MESKPVLAGFLAQLAVGRERSVDQPRVERQQIGGGDFQALTHRQRKVGDEDIGRGEEPIQHGEAVGMLQVDGQAALVAGGQLPIVVGRLAGDRRGGPPGIAGARRLDLDDIGAEVGKDGRGGRPCDPARAIDDFQARKQALRHVMISFLSQLPPPLRTAAIRLGGATPFRHPRISR